MRGVGINTPAVIPSPGICAQNLCCSRNLQRRNVEVKSPAAACFSKNATCQNEVIEMNQRYLVSADNTGDELPLCCVVRHFSPDRNSKNTLGLSQPVFVVPVHW
jgi:hypothetical protein